MVKVEHCDVSPPTTGRSAAKSGASSVLERAKINAAAKSACSVVDDMYSEERCSSNPSFEQTGTGAFSLTRSYSARELRKETFCRRKLSSREQLTIWFIILQIIMLLVGNFAAKGLETAVLHLEIGTATSLIAGVELLYLTKVIQMGLGFKGTSGESLIKNYARNADPANQAAVKTRLAAEIKSRQIEFSTLLDKDMRILVNSNRNRTGEVWDPSGVLSQLKAAYSLSTNITQIKIAATLTHDELMREQPPLWLERADIGSPGLVWKHPYITSGEALIRYTATVVRDNTTIIGYLVSGDLMDGKLSLPGLLKLALWGSASTLVTDGYIGLYAADTDPQQTLNHAGWRSCSHAAIATISALHTRTMSAEVDPEILDLLEQAQRENGTSVSIYADKRSSYVYSAKMAAPLYVGPPGLAPPSESPAILVQASFSPYWYRAWWSSMRITVLIFAIDIVALSLAFVLFLFPLEKLGRRVRDGKPLSATATIELKHRRYWLVVVLLIPLLSFLLSIYNMIASMKYFHDAQLSTSVKQTAMVSLTYNVKIEQCRLGFIGLSNNPLVIAYGASMAASTDPGSVPSSDIKSLLQAQIALRKIELAAYVGIDHRMWINANTAVAPGILWDTPAGSVSEALLAGFPVVSSEILTYEQYSVFNATTWTKPFTPTTPPSTLHPEMTKSDVLVRFMIVPVTSVAADGAIIVLGALVAADIINGMTEIPEYANALVAREGYAAIYIRPPNATSDYELVSSALINNNATEVDVPLSPAYFDKILTPIYTDPTTITNARIQLEGENHILTARCAPQGYILLADGRLFNQVRPGTRCSIIFVQTTDEEFTQEDWRKNMVVQLLLICAQCIKLFALFLLLRSAFVPFKNIVLSKGMVRIKR